MARTRTLLATLLVALLGTGLAFAQVEWDTTGFDPYEEDEGYVDLQLDGSTLVLTLGTEEGAIPATIEGDTLPLDEDFEEDRLRDRGALGVYGGMPVTVSPNSTTPTSVTAEVEGDPRAIEQALVNRARELGLTVQDPEVPGGVMGYRLSDGENNWRLSIRRIGGDGASIHLSAEPRTLATAE